MINQKYRAQARGLTLVELMVAMALGLIIMAAVYSMYMGVLKVAAILEGEKSLARRARVIVRFFYQDIVETDLNKSTLINIDGKTDYEYKQDKLVAIAMPRAYGKDDTLFQTEATNGLPIWKSLRVYYILPHTTDLRMKEVYFQNPDDLKLPISEKQLEEYCDGRNDTALAENVAFLNLLPVYVMLDGEPVYIDIEVNGKKVKKKKIGSMQIFANPFFYNRNNTKSYYKFTRTIYSRNSYYEDPGPPHTPYPTPTPPSTEPIVPSDWND